MIDASEPGAPSLLEAESRGGDVNERGKMFEAAVILSSIPRWMAMEGFTSMLREGMGDVEAKFFVPGQGWSWLRVFTSANTAHLGHSGGQER